MTTRKNISKKLRFDVFKRDEFICQYCGHTPPRVVLEVDHILPVCEGGENDEDNLITACFDCNRGKGGRLLTSTPETVKSKAAKVKEQELQIKAYVGLKKKKRARLESSTDYVEREFQKVFPDIIFNDRFRSSVRTNFLSRFDQYELEEFMEIACARFSRNGERALTYFCGICWKRIKDHA